MMTFERTATIQPGKMSAALSCAHKIAHHIKQLTGTDFKILIPVGGDPLRIKWQTEVQGLSAVEALQGKLLQDKTYSTLTEEIGDSLIAVQDDFWRAV